MSRVRSGETIQMFGEQVEEIRSVREQDVMKTSIRIVWSGEAKKYLLTREFEVYADDGMSQAVGGRTLTRTDSKAIIKTKQEARGLRFGLKNVLDNREPAGNVILDKEGTTWYTHAHKRAYERVLEELVEEMDSRGIKYDHNWDNTEQFR